MSMNLQINSSNFPFIILCCSLLFLLVIIIKYFRRIIINTAAVGGRGPKLNLPPGPKKLPFIGNLHLLAGSSEMPHRRLSELTKLYGAVAHLQIGEVSLVMVSDAETAKEVLKTQDLNFAQRFQSFTSEMMTINKSSVVFAPYGDYWRTMRKIVVRELLSASRVRSYRLIREEEAKNMIEDISSTCGSIINLNQKMVSYSVSVTCKSALGKDFKLKQQEQEQLVQLLREAIELAGGFNMSEAYPSIRIFRYLHGLNRKTRLFGEKMNNIFGAIILSNLKNKKNNNNKNKTTSSSDDHDDLIDVLLRIQDQSNTINVIADLFVAGIESTSMTAEWAMSEMLRNPTVMKKAQAEVREAMQGKEDIEESDLEGLKYLKLVIKETLRLHPAAPLVPREARESCKINGYDVPSKSKVVINVWAIGRDPRYWRDPDKFEPERFLESPVNFTGSHFQFLPFGSGKRMCPGVASANANMELMLAVLLYHFDWMLPDGHDELDMTEVFGATVKRKNNVCVIATKVRTLARCM